MKSRYLLIVFPSKYRWINKHRILEAGPQRLQLLAPSRLAHSVYIVASLATFFGPLLALGLLVSFTLQSLDPSVRGIIGLVPFAILFVPLYFLSKLTSPLALDIELRLTTNAPSRIMNVQVQEIQTLGRGWTQLVRLLYGGKEEWVRVQATRGVLQEALNLSGQAVPAN